LAFAISELSNVLISYNDQWNALYTPVIEVMCIRQNQDRQKHPANPSLHIPVRFFSAGLSRGTRLDLCFATMVLHVLQAAAAVAQGVYGLWIGVYVILPAGQMMVA
jgi:hypothetical protein